jgi:hypothetical protein
MSFDLSRRGELVIHIVEKRADFLKLLLWEERKG